MLSFEHIIYVYLYMYILYTMAMLYWIGQAEHVGSARSECPEDDRNSTELPVNY